MEDFASRVVIGEGPVPLKRIIDVAKGKRKVEISDNPEFIKKIENSQKMLQKALEDRIPVYGVTTGFGKSCSKRMSMEMTLNNGSNLIKFHGCGTGVTLGIEETRAAMMTRILCFSNGYSGVSMNLLNHMADFLNYGITPCVPCEGSVGASGDLTPMSYIAAALVGERDVFFRGERMPSAEALEKAGLSKYIFEPKEPLAIINGTSTMTGIAALVIDRSYRILEASIVSSALTIHALMGNVHHYHPTISKAKPHKGQGYVSNHLLQLLETKKSQSEHEAKELETLQDPYSIRCSPQIAGVLYDSLEWICEWVEIEGNSNNDNPIFDPESGQTLMGGNFYGGHISMAMDSLKAALASVSDMVDRQMALLVNPNVNRGLPADLVISDGDQYLYNYGFKAMSIATSALTAEALKNTMPAASFSRSTESHNQDKVSMGTIAARDADRICELVERTIAINLIAAVQACEIRGNIKSRPNIFEIVNNVRSIVDPILEDRPMDEDIEKIVNAIRKSDIFRLNK